MRLNKFIAENTGMSRREADELIQAGRVTFSQDKSPQTARLGQQIDDKSQVFVDNKLITNREEHTTIVLNKPVGYLSSRRSQGGDPTVYDLLPSELKTLKTAGRLDKDSSGLMILSSDGDLIQRLTHPKHKKTKIYKIELDKALQPLHQQMISDFGVELPDGKSKFSLGHSGDRIKWQVTMHEGRNRQIRRTFAVLGYNVEKLHRTQLGSYTLEGIKPGKYLKIKV